MKKAWLDSLDAAITVCNKQGKIVYLNDKAASKFSKYGGFELLGRNLFDCHSKSSGDTIQNMLDKRQTNIYTIEKAGIKTLICQKPVFEKKKFYGIMEIAVDLPSETPHHIRD